MIKNRLDLHTLLESVSGLAIKKDGVPAVYFQPPTGFKMIYPCIVYKKLPFNIRYADNNSYILDSEYSITVIDPNPDTKIPENLVKTLKTVAPVRNYVYDNLYHFNFSYF